MKRAGKTIALILILAASSVFLAVAGEHLPLGPHGRDTAILLLPAIPFAALGYLANRIYGSAYISSLVLCCIGANALLHYFGCEPMWKRTASEPGLVFSSVFVDVLYHLCLVGIAWGIARLNKPTSQ